MTVNSTQFQVEAIVGWSMCDEEEKFRMFWMRVEGSFDEREALPTIIVPR